MSFFRSFEVWVFFTLTIALGSAAIAVSVLVEDENISMLAVLTPSLAAIVVAGFARGRQGLRDLLMRHVTRRFAWRWLFAAIFIVPAIALICAAAQAMATGRAFALATADVLPYVVVTFVIAIGEEFGWRAYAMRQLGRRYSVFMSGAVVGAFWAVWHLPGALVGVGVPLETPFLLFAVWVVGAALLVGWIYARTASVIPAILFHAAANAAFIYLPLLPEHVGNLWPFAGFVALVGAAVAFVYVRNRDLFVAPDVAKPAG